MNEYADRLADAAEDALAGICKENARAFVQTAALLQKLGQAIEEHRNQPQETHRCEGCERREREIERLVESLEYIKRRPTTPADTLAHDALADFRKGRGA